MTDLTATDVEAPTPPHALTVVAPAGIPEVNEGADLAGLLLAALDPTDGDIVVVTSKVVAKQEGRVRTGDRSTAVAEETARVVARRGSTTIVRNRLGLTLAAAGVDASNVEHGRIVLLPVDPDASARRLRAEVWRRAGVNVGVVITDTAGRAWRIGQTDQAVGAAGVRVIESFAGRIDPYGNPLAVTAPAVADELAGAAELTQGKLSGRPIALVRGRSDLVLPVEEDGPGATALVREPAGDLFGYGAREAVIRALAGVDVDRVGFGAPASPDELIDALVRVLGPDAVDRNDRSSDDEPADRERVATVSVTGPADAVAAVAFAHGWAAQPDSRSDSWLLAPLSD